MAAADPHPRLRERAQRNYLHRQAHTAGAAVSGVRARAAAERTGAAMTTPKAGVIKYQRWDRRLIGTGTPNRGAPCACGCGGCARGTYKPGHRPIQLRIPSVPPPPTFGAHFDAWRAKPVVRPPKHYRSVMVNAVPKRVHVLRAEHALGRPLPKGAVVHHADGSISDHAPLVICEDTAYHHLLHVRTRVYRAGGNPDTDAFCAGCQTAKHKSHFWRHVTRCRDCLNKSRRERSNAAHTL